LTMIGPETFSRRNCRGPKIVKDGTPPGILETATPTGVSGGGFKLEDVKSEIRNSMGVGGRHSEFRIPNSEFEIPSRDRVPR